MPTAATAMSDESIENLFASLSAQSWQLLEQFPKKLRKVINKKLKTNRAKKRFLAAGLAVCLCAGATILLNASSHTLKTEYVKWGDFRAYVSQQLVIAPSELDFFFKNVCSADTSPNTKIDVTQVALIERALKQKLGDEVKIFPNPFFGNCGVGLGAITFSDVALDHPVYKALQPLLELGVNCGDSQTRINPYEKMQWTDWEKINTDLTTLLGQEKEPVPGVGKGFMSSNDLKFYLANLRRKFCITRTEKIDNSSGGNAPSRLEALSALAMVVAELNNTN